MASTAIPPYWERTPDNHWVRQDGYEFEPLPNRPGWKLIRGRKTAEMRVYFVSIVLGTSHVDEIDPFSDQPD